MFMQVIFGILAVILAGLISGSGAWPMKLMRRYQFEHWWLVGMFAGLIVIPWTVTLVFCPHLATALQSVPLKTFVLANLWATGWGVANILCGVCYVRIGMALTTAILSGMGVCLGVALPLVVKGAGSFQQAPAIVSPAGLTVLGGAMVALLAVLLAGKAGFERERVVAGPQPRSGGFTVSLVLAILAGVFSCGYTMSFVYGQGPVVEALKKYGAGDVPAAFAVWAVGLTGGALVSVGYAVILLTKNESWGVLFESRKEFCLAAVIGLNMAVSIALLGNGMLLMGALGASVGAGLQQIAWMLGGQSVGFLSGEWRGAGSRSRMQIYLAGGLLSVAALIMACDNVFSKATP
jgi:L-rhamnose-H+ transport protein